MESLAALLSPKRTRAEMSPPHRWSDRALLPPFSACCVRRCMCVHTHTQVRTQVYTYMPAPITHTHTPCTYNTHAHTHTRTCTPPQTLPSQVHGWPSTARFLVDEETAWPLPTPIPWSHNTKGCKLEVRRCPGPQMPDPGSLAVLSPGNGPPPGTQAREKAEEPPFLNLSSIYKVKM